MISATARCGCNKLPCGDKKIDPSLGSSFSSLFDDVVPRLQLHNVTCTSESTEFSSLDSSSFDGTITSTTTENTIKSNADSCPCGSSDSESSCSSDGDEKDAPNVVLSEIESSAQPYKEIEAVINNNRMVIRLQTEKEKLEYEPTCDCIENPKKSNSSLVSSNSQCSRKHDVIFQKANEGCRTINVYPQPDFRPAVAPPPTILEEVIMGTKLKRQPKKKEVVLPVVNPEENPNIFVLRIKRKCQKGDKKHSLNLEFKTPRPWRKVDKLHQDDDKSKTEDDEDLYDSEKSRQLTIGKSKEAISAKSQKSLKSDIDPNVPRITRKNFKCPTCPPCPREKF